MIAVFWFSSQNSLDSTGASSKTVKAILKIMPWAYSSEEEMEALAVSMQPIVRKLAHFTLYTLGGILISLYVNEHNAKDIKQILISIIIGIVYAVSDEIHQIFVPRKGRNGN